MIVEKSDKYLLSFNQKLMHIDPRQVIELIKMYSNGKIIGIECVFPFDDEYFYEILLGFAKELRNNDMIMQIHAITCNDELNLKKYIEKLKRIIDCYGRKVHVVFHSIYDENKEESIRKTKQMLNVISDYSKKININAKYSIENLNVLDGKKRLDEKDIEKFIGGMEDIGFTYDIGHKIYDEGIDADLSISNILLKKLSNIHMHAPFNGKDHYPIFERNNYSIKILEIVEKLKNCAYNDNIVLEYSLDYITGENIIEKLINYIKLVKIL